MAALDDDVLTEVGCQLVDELAPRELPLSRSVSEAFVENRRRVRGLTGSRDDILSFGWTEAAFLTPVVLTALHRTSTYLAEAVLKELATATANAIKDHVKRLFCREPGAINLQKPQLAEIHRIALATAREFRLSDGRATLLADALVARLAFDRRS
jgi:hypothetical protein